MPRLVVNDLSYHFRCEGSGPPLLLLHGFTGSHANWAHLQAGFAEHFLTHVVDLPGHGKTDTPGDATRCRQELVSADLVALMARCGHNRFNLLGYSMGGRLALALTLCFPDKVTALVLESASPGLPTAAERERRQQQDEALAGKIEAEGVRRFVEEWEQLPLFASQRQLPSSVRNALRQQRLGNSAHGLATSLRGAGTGTQYSCWSQIPQLKTPTLLICGELDAKFCDLARRMVSANPALKLRQVAGAGHCVHLEQAQSFQRAAMDFLIGQEKRHAGI
ncbi:MAG: 2-succinyl-6-hydroxy-2,4-cyclohexadiene-1-carboxylate synthase [Anaerolineaceae bacterium]|nr:2-succinyl-6-hydroxy-2,4-cyclohexadiene-1-carboxylate synthase [Anaerolineaceae bacterium]MDE0329785.1 2-succinyl-6-hydroxy-2,4-cyclohexadiene-1-carboxylate synthase [Anaerolineaceae bacterium]